jgi:DnaJ C terminal domain
MNFCVTNTQQQQQQEAQQLEANHLHMMLMHQQEQHYLQQQQQHAINSMQSMLFAYLFAEELQALSNQARPASKRLRSSDVPSTLSELWDDDEVQKPNFKKRKMQPVYCPHELLEVELEELYTGTRRRRKVTVAGDVCQVEVCIPPHTLDKTQLEVQTASLQAAVFTVRARKHRLFEQRGCDLVLTARVSPNEARDGCSVYLTHLSGELIEVKQSSVTAGQCVVIAGKGMLPGFSDLVVQFEVDSSLEADSSDTTQ